MLDKKLNIVPGNKQTNTEKNKLSMVAVAKIHFKMNLVSVKYSTLQMSAYDVVCLTFNTDG